MWRDGQAGAGPHHCTAVPDTPCTPCSLELNRLHDEVTNALKDLRDTSGSSGGQGVERWRQRAPATKPPGQPEGPTHTTRRLTCVTSALTVSSESVPSWRCHSVHSSMSIITPAAAPDASPAWCPADLPWLEDGAEPGVDGMRHE
jgi:hypothetical protein